MDAKKVFFSLIVSTLLVGSVCAAKSVNDFSVDESYDNVHNGTYFSLSLNEKQDSGIAIFKNVNDDAYDNESDDAYDNLIHDDGKDYITVDDDMKINENSDNTVNFTDIDHGEQGIAELIDCDGQQFIVVFWAKDTSDVKDSDLSSMLNEFNKENNVDAIAF
jgi:hypothetical protein